MPTTCRLTRSIPTKNAGAARWCALSLSPSASDCGSAPQDKVGNPISPRPHYYGPEQEWEVVAIEPTSRDGQEVRLRGWGFRPGWGRSDSGEPEPSPIMRGKLVLVRSSSRASRVISEHWPRRGCSQLLATNAVNEVGSQE